MSESTESISSPQKINWEEVFQRTHKEYKACGSLSRKLTWSIERSHVATVRYLVDTKKVPIDTPFSGVFEGRAPPDGEDGIVAEAAAAAGGPVGAGGAAGGGTYSSKGQRPLYLAAQFGSAEIVDFLIRRGCEVDFKSPDGSSPLYIAAQNGHLAAFELLVNSGGNIECTFRYDGGSPPSLVSS
jgi:hypothetical protein